MGEQSFLDDPRHAEIVRHICTSSQDVCGLVGGLVAQVVVAMVVESFRSWQGSLVLYILRAIIPAPGTLLKNVDYLSNSPQEAAKLDSAGWAQLQLTLKELGVQRATARYADSHGGSIAEVEFTPEAAPHEVARELKRLAGQFLAKNWDLGAGSYGEIVLDVGRRTIVQRHYVRCNGTKLVTRP